MNKILIAEKSVPAGFLIKSIQQFFYCYDYLFLFNSSIKKKLIQHLLLIVVVLNIMPKLVKHIAKTCFCCNSILEYALRKAELFSR